MTGRRRVNPALAERARALRLHSTFPERLLWSRLRAGRLAGLVFRRQHVIGGRIADFYCASARLVVEIDGLSHSGHGARDDARTATLRRAGVRVIRFTNDEVPGDVDLVAEAIAREAGVPW